MLIGHAIVVGWCWLSDPVVIARLSQTQLLLVLAAVVLASVNSHFQPNCPINVQLAFSHPVATIQAHCSARLLKLQLGRCCLKEQAATNICLAMDIFVRALADALPNVKQQELLSCEGAFTMEAVSGNCAVLRNCFDVIVRTFGVWKPLAVSLFTDAVMTKYGTSVNAGASCILC